MKSLFVIGQASLLCNLEKDPPAYLSQLNMFLALMEILICPMEVLAGVLDDNIGTYIQG